MVSYKEKEKLISREWCEDKRRKKEDRVCGAGSCSLSDLS